MVDPVILERPKLVAKSLGNPKKVLAMDAAGARHLIGTIYGVASRVKSKVTPDKAGNPQVFEQIVGDFEGVPADPLFVDEDGVQTPVKAIRSGVLYLPAGIHERLAEPLKREDTQPIEFAIEIYTVKADNPIGYGYEVKSLMAPAAADPLEKMRALVGGTTQKRLENKPGAAGLAAARTAKEKASA